MHDKGPRGGQADLVELYFVRHAHAGDPVAWSGLDAARPLSRKGERQAQRLAAFLSRAGVRAEVLVSSPKLRATQTAERIAEALGMPVRIEPLLESGAGLADVERILIALGNPRSAILVGHDPDFSDMVSDLTGAASLPIAKGAALRIDVRRPVTRGAGTLRWLVPPELLASD